MYDAFVPDATHKNIEGINVSAYKHPANVLIGNVSAKNISNEYLYIPTIANASLSDENLQIDVFWT